MYRISKGHLLSNPLHSRRWLKTRRRSIEIYLELAKLFCRGSRTQQKSFLGFDRVFLRNAETVYSDTNTLPQAAQSNCLAHLICRRCERRQNTAIQEAKHNEFWVRTFSQTLCKTIAISVA